FRSDPHWQPVHRRAHAAACYPGIHRRTRDRHADPSGLSRVPSVHGRAVDLACHHYVHPCAQPLSGAAVRPMTPPYTLTDDVIALPTGAWAATHRRTLRHRGQPVLALSQGKHRAYVYPLFTPTGFAVTSEHPADHPHHNSFWIAADHLYCRMPVTHGKGYEDYTYNLYLDETFQGRAPGRIVETSCRGEPDGTGFRIVQTLEWRGPVEWAAPTGRLAARETRTLRIAAQEQAHVIDIESRLAAM